jgi:hypothetical protein
MKLLDLFGLLIYIDNGWTWCRSTFAERQAEIKIFKKEAGR